MSPFADAMGFIDCKLRNVPVQCALQKRVEHQPLRRDIQQPVLAALQAAPALARCRSNVEFKNVAAIPLVCSASTWSFINEINGDTTIVSPSRKSAGS